MRRAMSVRFMHPRPVDELKRTDIRRVPVVPFTVMRPESSDCGTRMS